MAYNPIKDTQVQTTDATVTTLTSMQVPAITGRASTTLIWHFERTTIRNL